MKKTFAVLLVLALCLSMIPAAFAAEVDTTVLPVNWEDREGDIAAKGLNGEFVTVSEDLGMKMWLWDALHSVEVTEEMSNKQGFIALYTDDSETNYVAVSLWLFEAEDVTVEDLVAMLQEAGAETMYFIELNGVPGVAYNYHQEETEINVVCLNLGGGYVSEVAFTMGDSSFDGPSSIMAASVMFE